MRDSRVRLFWLMLLVMALGTISSSLWALAPVSIWPTYHGDMFRSGINAASIDIKNPASLELIWVFPQATEAGVVDDYKFIVDNWANAGFVGWGNEYFDAEAWGYVVSGVPEESPYSYCRVPAQPRQDADGKNTTPKSQATWLFPDAIPKGYYQVWVWVPPGPPVIVGEAPSPKFNYTKKAVYSVTDANGTSNVVFDQTRGGTWQLLSATPYNFTGIGNKVVLTDRTNDTQTEIANDRLWIAADAIKFVGVTGKEIYSSPVSAEIDYEVKLDSGNTWQGGASWKGRIPVVYFGSVEQPVVKGAGAEDMGVVWCINSITPDNTAVDYTASNTDPANAARKQLAALLGTPVWRYPRDFAAMKPDEVTSFLAEANSGIEGPIEGGIYSSPTLANVGGTVDKLECLVAAMDRQVYSLDAETGKLLWKGPGVTVSESNTNKLYKTVPDDTDLTKLTLRDDAFGGQYRWAECTDNDPNSKDVMSWDFNTDLTDKTGQPTVSPATDGWSYNVFVWLPVAKGDEGGKVRANDAVYTITYRGDLTAVVKVNQSLRANQGRWVKLGAFFNVSKVELTTKIELLDPMDPTKPTGAKHAANEYCVVADAAMIVPETIGAFSYSSIATDVDLAVREYPASTQKATKAYACTAVEGRLIAFDLTASKPADLIGKVDWVYPAIRTKYTITNPNTNAGGDQPSLGAVGASPTYYKNNGIERVYLPTLGGTLFSLDAKSGEKMAAFDTPAVDVTNSPGSVRSGFTSSVTVGKTGALGTGDPMVFAASTAGLLYALDPLKLEVKATSKVAGAYRYSTPSVVKTPSKNYLWAASTDSSVRAYEMGTDLMASIFTSNPTAEPAKSLAPKVQAAVQGSPAFDGEKLDSNGVNSVTMYVGDMDGYLSWFNAETGKSDWSFDFSAGQYYADGSSLPADSRVYANYQCDGALFASPNVTNFLGNNISMSYVYAAGADGRLYAFSQAGGAWGGMFAQRYRRPGRNPDRWHNHGTDRDDSREPPRMTAQAELVKQQFYDQSIGRDPQPTKIVDVLDKDGKVIGTRAVLIDENADGTPWSTDWIIGKDMKKPTKTFTVGTDDATRTTRNTEIEKYLILEAKMRRGTTFVDKVTGKTEDAVFPDLKSRANHDPIYFEWGETLNVVIWNLPELLFLSGGNAQSAGSSFVFKFQNTSEGESSGNLIRQAGRVTLKEYTVLSTDPEKDEKGAVIANAYKPLKHGWGHTVKRCYAMAQIVLDHKKNPPFSPGPGWNLVVEFPRKVSSADNAPTTQVTVPIAELNLKGGVYEPNLEKEEPLGINNPLCIRDDMDAVQGYSVGATYTGIGWPAIESGQYKVVNGARKMRNLPDRHYNGNASGTSSSDYMRTSTMPFVDYQFVNNGTASRQAALGVMEASAVGTRIQNILAPATGQTTGEIIYTKIDNFRIQIGDLHWQGGPEAIASSGGIWFPWEYGPGSIDYPNIPPSRQDYRKAYDDGLPATAPTILPCVEGGIAKGASVGAYDSSNMRPDVMFTAVDVPRFQPALISPVLSDKSKGPLPIDFNSYGYARTMTAFIDSNMNGGCDFGDTVIGRPTVNQECYRRFKVGVMVPADPKIEVEEELVDIGIAPHGLGEWMKEPWEFNAYNEIPSIRQWFQPVTIKNAGNINLKNMKIGRKVELVDSTGRVAPIPFDMLTSSLDELTALPASPILRMLKTKPLDSSNYNLGYTISKARVGEPDPTKMTIPDKRKWDLDFDGARTYTKELYRNFAGLINGLPQMGDKIDPEISAPMNVYVSTKIPLSQPVGVYQSFDKVTGTPYVPVFSDSNDDQRLDNNEYYSQKSFQLKATVKETQLTGGITDSSLPHIDGGVLPKYGDATPAAMRDPVTGNVLLVWSSGRVLPPADQLALPTQFAASSPWVLSSAKLLWGGSDWVPNTPGQWWKLDQWSNNQTDPKPYLPYFLTASNHEWPSPLLGEYANWQVLPWAGNNKIMSVRHTSPVFAQYTVRNNNADEHRAVMAWAGTADISDNDTTKSGAATYKVAQEHRIFYTAADGADVTSADKHVYAIEHNPAMVKRSPSIAMDGAKMWAFWQGGSGGSWSLYCSASDDPFNEDRTRDRWTPDTKLLLPDCLTTVSSPNALLRNTSVDVIYAGATKLSATSDIMLTKYNAVDDPASAQSPKNKAHSLPRVFAEKLERDTKYGFYSSKHLAWMRAGVGAPGVLDNWGEYTVGDKNADLPYIRIVLPVGYTYKGSNGANVIVKDETAISATDGSVWTYLKDANGVWSWAPDTAGAVITPVTDEGSGTSSYRYPAGSLAKVVLGETIVDYSAGIVRVTNPLGEQKSGDAFLSANVYADYTPRTWRFTTGNATDDSPRAFIEQTRSMFKRDKDNTPVSVDRLWTFWRKAAVGAQSSTIYFATYRMGVNLADLFKRNKIEMLPDTKYWITGVDGIESWEIDGSRSKVYFRQSDEAYRTLANSTTAPAAAVTVHYSYIDSKGDTKDGELVAQDVFWIPELQEQSLLGFSADGNVNEGSIYAFADPIPGTLAAGKSSKIWLFWTSTRGGTSDLFWETISPELAAR